MKIKREENLENQNVFIVKYNHIIIAKIPKLITMAGLSFKFQVNFFNLIELIGSD